MRSLPFYINYWHCQFITDISILFPISFYAIKFLSLHFVKYLSHSKICQILVAKNNKINVLRHVLTVRRLNFLANFGLKI
jgi:hypothetical protein